MTDVEDVRQRVPLVKAQDSGLGPPDHQYAKVTSQRRPGAVIKAALDTRARVLQAAQATLHLTSGDSGARLTSRGLDRTALRRYMLAPGRQSRAARLPFLGDYVVRGDDHTLAIRVRNIKAERFLQDVKELRLHGRLSHLPLQTRKDQ
jgi:hypothetical protein